MSFTYCAYLRKIDFASRPNVSGNSLISHRKNMPPITKAPILEGPSDLTRVSLSLTQ